MSDMHKMNKNNIFDFVLTLPVEGSVCQCINQIY